jgi:hypothetical protein
MAYSEKWQKRIDEENNRKESTGSQGVKYSEKWQNRIDQQNTTVEDWVNQINSHAFEVSDYVSGGGLRSDEGYSSIQANRNRLREQGEYFKRKYAGNDDALTYLDSLLGVIDNIETGEEYPMAQTEFSKIAKQLQRYQDQAGHGIYLTQEDVGNYSDLTTRYLELGNKIYTPEYYSDSGVNQWKELEAAIATSVDKIARMYEDNDGNHLDEDTWSEQWKAGHEYLELLNTDISQLDYEIFAMEKQGNQAAADALKERRNQAEIVQLDDTAHKDPHFSTYLKRGADWVEIFAKETSETSDPISAFFDEGAWNAEHLSDREKETAQYLLGKVLHLEKDLGDKEAAQAEMDKFERYDDYLRSTTENRAAAY